MKKTNLFYILFLFISHLSISQSKPSVNAVYLDSLFDLASEKDYKYIRIIKDYDIPDKESYDLTYFYKSGNIAMSGATTSRTSIVRTGPFVTYHENGKRKAITNYKQDKPYGSYYEFYENGNKKIEAEWCDAPNAVITNIRIKNYWNLDSNLTIKDGNGYYEEIYTKNAQGFVRGKVKNNLKDSIWIGEFKKPNFKFVENYKAGKLILGVSIDSSGVERKYTVVDVSPRPKKGMEDFYRYVANNFKVPFVEGLRGKIFLAFVVEKDGTVKNCIALNDPGYEIGQEAVRVVMGYKDWMPGAQRGMKVRTRFSLPINFESNR